MPKQLSSIKEKGGLTNDCFQWLDPDSSSPPCLPVQHQHSNPTEVPLHEGDQTLMPDEEESSVKNKVKVKITSVVDGSLKKHSSKLRHLRHFSTLLLHAHMTFNRHFAQRHHLAPRNPNPTLTSAHSPNQIKSKHFLFQFLGSKQVHTIFVISQPSANLHRIKKVLSKRHTMSKFAPKGLMFIKHRNLEKFFFFFFFFYLIADSILDSASTV